MSHSDVAEAALGMPQVAQVRGKSVIFGNVLVFLLSLTLHTVVLAALWFLAVPALGSGEGAGGYITVSLLGGLPGDSGGAGSGTVSASAGDAAASTAATPPTESESSADAKAHEPPSVTPAQETVPIPVPGADHVTQRAEADPAEPAKSSLPVTDAAIPVRTTKPVPKDKPAASQRTSPQPANPPANPAVKKSSHEQARPASHDTAQQGEKASGLGHEGGGMAAGHSGQAGGQAGGQSGGQAGQKGGESGGENSAAGQGGSVGYLKGNYEYIKKRVRQYLVYSPQAKRMGIQGMVTVSFTIQQDGRVRDVAVSKSSGYSLLDESALEAVRSAAPFAAPPESARVIMPVQFSLR